MNYELAQKLKTAGYPQKVSRRYSVVYEEGNSVPSQCVNEDCYCPVCNDRPFVVIPTLEELIKACGDTFYCLKQEPVKNGWEAQGFISYTTLTLGKGKTPTEAVAKLWIELNK